MNFKRMIPVVVLSSAIAVVAGCAMNGAPTSAVTRTVTQSRVEPNAGTTLIYVCVFTANECIWYDRGSNQVAGTITGLSFPSGVAVDKTGAVYIANFSAQNIPVYAKGSTTLLRTLDDSGHLPADVTVDTNGVVYVANFIDVNAASGSISVFAPGSTTVSRVITDPNFGDVTGVAVDEHHELVACYNNSNGGFCDEFDHARGHGRTVVSNPGSGGMQGVAFDNAGDLAVQSVLSGTQYFTTAFATCGTDPLNGQEQYVAFDRKNGDIYKTNTNGYVEENEYTSCSGGIHERRYTAGLTGLVPYGVAIDPAKGI
jgi:hypothetical protein